MRFIFEDIVLESIVVDRECKGYALTVKGVLYYRFPEERFQKACQMYDLFCRLAEKKLL